MRRHLPSPGLLALAGLLHAGSAHAQDTAAERCMSLAGDANKLECLQAALVAAERALEQADIPLPAPPVAGAGQAQAAGPVKSAGQAAGFAALGKEQLAANRAESREQDEEQRFGATVVAFRERVPGRMMFQLDNGQVWQQTAADAQRLRLPEDEPLPVELWGSWSGGYRMLIKNQRRTARVERVR